jgi:hypothetical protein
MHIRQDATDAMNAIIQAIARTELERSIVATCTVHDDSFPNRITFHSELTEGDALFTCHHERKHRGKLTSTHLLRQ